MTAARTCIVAAGQDCIQRRRDDLRVERGTIAVVEVSNQSRVTA